MPVLTADHTDPFGDRNFTPSELIGLLTSNRNPVIIAQSPWCAYYAISPPKRITWGLQENL